jgi:hypothetical protein
VEDGSVHVYAVAVRCVNVLNALCILEALTHSYEYLEHVVRLTILFTIKPSLQHTNPAGNNYQRSYPHIKKREESTSEYT